MPTATTSRSIRDEVVNEIRKRLASGLLVPEERLSEHTLATELEVSRNTLRESFRVLTQEGLLTHIPNRGVFVTKPTASSVYDIFHVRRMIECQALSESIPAHPAIDEMKQAIEDAQTARDMDDWLAVGTANIAFHKAIIRLADSARLERFFDALTAELRLIFGLIDDLQYLHGTFMERNEEIYRLAKEKKMEDAAKALDIYLRQSEQIIMASYRMKEIN